MNIFRLRCFVGLGLVAPALVLAGCSSGSGSTPVAPSYNSTTKAHPTDQQRSLNDFINAQGTFCAPVSWGVPPGAEVVNNCIIYVPPVANFEGWATLKTTSWCPVGIPLAAVDYAGLANAYIISQGGPSLNTTFSGSVSEHPLSDGTAQVIVNLNTKDALSWGGCDPSGSQYGFDFATATVMFGNQAPAVLAGSPPALGNSTMQIKYIEPQPGAPMPDLIPLLGGALTDYTTLTVKFHASADGELQAAYGVPAGTPGHLVIEQTGTFKQVGKAQEDGYTAEKIQITKK